MLIVCIFYVWSSQSEQQYRYESQQQLHLSLAANLARDNPLLQKGIYDHEALQNLFHTLMVLGPAFEFYFLDPSGKILTHSSDSSTIKREQVDLTPLIDLTHNQKQLPIYGDDPRNIERQKIFSAAPVFNGNTLQGYLYVIVTSELYDDVFNEGKSIKHTEFSLWLVGSALCFLFIVGLGLFRYFTKPLRGLIQEIQTIQNLEQINDMKVNLEPLPAKLTWKENTYNEVHQLGAIYQKMLARINEQVGMLKRNDEHRREILADISHDLRTPLASLQGYIETLLLNDETLEPDKRKRFIGTALKNAQQLKKLIDQIFELAHLENDKASVNIEPFNVMEFMYDVSAKFAIKLEKKHITINIIPPSSSDKIFDFQVMSDIGKLERVVSNLIENAIRHTSKKGHIDIKISAPINFSQMNENTSQQPLCHICISDTGTGIKNDELAYIFDARYRASNAIQDEESHNGLGLAITKKLLLLMNTEIKVSSELNVGSDFSFNLPIASKKHPLIP